MTKTLQPIINSVLALSDALKQLGVEDEDFAVVLSNDAARTLVSSVDISGLVHDPSPTTNELKKRGEFIMQVAGVRFVARDFHLLARVKPWPTRLITEDDLRKEFPNAEI